jgi:hypothetical protein
VAEALAVAMAVEELAETRLRRWAKTLFRSVPAHSMRRAPVVGTLTAKDISLFAVGTPSSPNRRIRFG